MIHFKLYLKGRKILIILVLLFTGCKTIEQPTELEKIAKPSFDFEKYEKEKDISGFANYEENDSFIHIQKNMEIYEVDKSLKLIDGRFHKYKKYVYNNDGYLIEEQILFWGLPIEYKKIYNSHGKLISKEYFPRPEYKFTLNNLIDKMKKYRIDLNTTKNICYIETSKENENIYWKVHCQCINSDTDVAADRMYSCRFKFSGIDGSEVK